MAGILNAFIQTRVQHKNDVDIIKIIGALLDILIQIAPYIYEPYVITYCRGIKQLIIQYQNAIYVTMMASIL